jgi:hypothetical protein
VVDGLELDRGPVAKFFVKALVVVPGDPPEDLVLCVLSMKEDRSSRLDE